MSSSDPVNRCDKRVVWAAFNKTVQKRNLFGLFTFNGEFDAVVTAVEVFQKLVSGVFAVKHGKSVINISLPECRVKSCYCRCSLSRFQTPLLQYK